jgi:hypothetical protein
MVWKLAVFLRAAALLQEVSESGVVEPAAEAQTALLETQAAKMMCCCHEMWPSVPRGTHRPYPPMTIELDCIWTHTRWCWYERIKMTDKEVTMQKADGDVVQLRNSEGVPVQTLSNSIKSKRRNGVEVEWATDGMDTFAKLDKQVDFARINALLFPGQELAGQSCMTFKSTEPQTLGRGGDPDI